MPHSFLYLLNLGVTDATLLLVLLGPVEMLDIHVLLQLLLRQELLLTQLANRPDKKCYRRIRIRLMQIRVLQMLLV